MKITADTNLFVRVIVRDDEKQARAAEKLLDEAELVAVPLITLCEVAWVLHSVYRLNSARVADAIEIILSSDSVVTDRVAAEAGLALLRNGGDFADGVIAHEGGWLGGETFVSFDKDAVRRLAEKGIAARLLA